MKVVMYSVVFPTGLTTLTRINIDLHNIKVLITKLYTRSMTHDS